MMKKKRKNKNKNKNNDEEKEDDEESFEVDEEWLIKKDPVYDEFYDEEYEKNSKYMLVKDVTAAVEPLRKKKTFKEAVQRFGVLLFLLNYYNIYIYI
jgi:hypothetical protein